MMKYKSPIITVIQVPGWIICQSLGLNYNDPGYAGDLEGGNAYEL